METLRTVQYLIQSYYIRLYKEIDKFGLVYSGDKIVP